MPSRACAAASSRRWVTPANGLTALRLLAAPALLLAVRADAAAPALALFALAVATDLLDGPLARRRGEASARGGLLDHGSDALFVGLGLGALALRGEVPVLLPGLLALAFLQYAVDSRALEGHPLRTSPLGRWNGIAYFVLLGAALFRDGLGLDAPTPQLVRALGWVLLATTLASMLERGLASRSLRRARRASADRLDEAPGGGPARRGDAAPEDPPR